MAGSIDTGAVVDWLQGRRMLPPAETVIEAMAQAELEILLNKEAGPNQELLKTAWFLHGVASSHEAVKVYGLPKRRAAFAVSAHIFDIMLATAPDLSVGDRAAYCFASQIAYLRSELAPNTIAIYKQQREKLLPYAVVSENPSVTSVIYGAALLAMDTGFLFKLEQGAALLKAQMKEDWGIENPDNTIYGSTFQLIEAGQNLLRYLLSGQVSLLSECKRLLKLALSNQIDSMEATTLWVCAHVMNVVDDLGEASVWSALPPNVPREVRRGLALGVPRILMLWPPQIELSKLDPSPFHSSVKRCVISTPTSGGKTLFAQIAIASHLATSSTAVCYVAPSRSLCREVTDSLASRLKYIDAPLFEGEIPEFDWTLEAMKEFFESETPAIEVMTPERFSFLVRTDLKGLLARYGLFVVDESHAIGDGRRGWMLESSLSVIHAHTQDSDHRLLLLSAATGNRNHFVTWLELDSTPPLCQHTEWRGPRRLTALWTTTANWRAAEACPLPNGPGRTVPLSGLLTISLGGDGKVKQLETIHPCGKMRVSANNKKVDGTPADEMLIPLVQSLCKGGPVLVVTGTRVSAARFVKKLSRSFRSRNSNSQLRDLKELSAARLGTEHSLTKALARGLAYHHAGIPLDLRAGIEDGVRAGIIKCVAATTTLTDGINLPVKTVLVAEQGGYGNSGNYENYITGPKLLNALGRAGRAAQETEGLVILALRKSFTLSQFDLLSPTDEELKVESLLALEKSLSEAVEFENRYRQNVDEIFREQGSAVSDFLSFTWQVNADAEDTDEPDHLTGLTSIIERTLAWQQLDESGKQVWTRVAEAGTKSYLSAPASRRKRWARCGTSLSCVEKLEEIATSLSREILGRPDSIEIAYTLILSNGRLERLLSLPDAPKKRFYNNRSGRYRQEIAIDWPRFLEDWLSGKTLTFLASEHFGLVPDIEFRFEQLGDLISEYVENYLPRFITIIVNWTSEIFTSNGREWLMPKDLPLYLRYGVNERASLELMLRGCQSRELAHKIVRRWADLGSPLTVKAWLRGMNLLLWQKNFKATAFELKNILQLIRDERGGPAVGLIVKGKAEFEIPAEVDTFEEVEVTIEELYGEKARIPRLAFLHSERILAYVPPQFHHDVDNIRSLQLPMSLHCLIKNTRARLTIQLEDSGGD